MEQFAVIGAGLFGSSVARTLSEEGCDVMLIDSDEERVRNMDEIVSQAVQLDATDEKSLKSVGIVDVDAVVVSVGKDMEASILITMLLKELGVKWVVAKAMSAAHYKILARLGADRIVFPEREMGVKVANSLMHPSVFDYIEVAPGYNISEIEPPPEIIGKSIEEAQVRPKYGIEIIAIKSKRPALDKSGDSKLEEEVKVVPKADEVIKEGDTIIVIGSEENLHNLKP
jgi:trk system potassium uptake protein TrkA